MVSMPIALKIFVRTPIIVLMISRSDFVRYAVKGEVSITQNTT